ncbi:hypothetical protein B0J15DRAFT_578735 [Fusarium solani]|uniref:Protein kinase domain-containing protein n=1 Tax=Fusarium solani TaxID=169388 RepID=A0A9P9KU72_FUSSL|nr:uncharacterized protein B0J15DRAFT_578735 [Fusarium solani]KAH7268549.1 hypothetical protein B0J15DRAFT_578735 [Fusarium solani]
MHLPCPHSSSRCQTAKVRTIATSNEKSTLQGDLVIIITEISSVFWLHRVPTPDSKEVCQLFGRHGDIKPENILWFSGPRPFTENYKGILKITDFGIAEFSTKPAVDRKRRGDAPNSATCCAPEIDLPVQVGGGLINPS